ncbi:MAG: PDZ domain-containing protein, partial [Clostridia bacterium]|nr:PDZ domain-containing protein [Clostridia bacterium]
MENENNNFEFNSENNPDVKIYASTSNSKKRSNFSFSKSVLVPFLSGAVGASIILGTCFGVPSIRKNLINNSYNSTPNLNYSSGGTNTAISLANYSGTAIDVASKVQPSIVGIQIEYSVTSFMFGGYSSNATASGSGIIISEDGYILTNNHVVSSSSNSSYYSMSEAQKITVKLYNSNETYEAKIVGSDSQTDLAIIKIDATGLTAAELGDSNSVKVGEFAMAIGNPLGLDSSVTCGIVSAINREVTDEDGNKYIAIQTDAAINSGNSGGALVNSEGKVIGINTLKLSGNGVEGIGFAIPISSTLDITQQLIQYNKVIRPYIGISGRDVTESLSKKYNYPIGIYIAKVEEFSPAEIAGLKIGDVITAIDGTPVSTMDKLNEIKNTHNVGDDILLTIYRNGETRDVTLVAVVAQ